MDPIASGGPALPVVSLDAFKRDPGNFEPAVEPQDVILRKQEAGSVLRTGMPDADTRRLDFIISSSAIDRDNDTIAVDGWKTAAYKKNPVVLFCHNYRSLPIGKASNIRVDGAYLLASAEFATADLNPLAESCFQMLRQGFLSATSVGFRPLKHARNEERGGWAVDFIEQELLEYSVVPVPANADALIQARNFGIDLEPVKLWCIQALDEINGEPGLWLPRASAERAWRIATGEPKTFALGVPPAEDLQAAFDALMRAPEPTGPVVLGLLPTDQAAPARQEPGAAEGEGLPRLAALAAAEWLAGEDARDAQATPPPDPIARLVAALEAATAALADLPATLQAATAGLVAPPAPTPPTTIAATTRGEADPVQVVDVDLTDPVHQRLVLEAMSAIADDAIESRIRHMRGQLPL